MKPTAPEPPVAAPFRKPKVAPQYKPPFTPLTPDNYDLYAGRSLAMLARSK